MVMSMNALTVDASELPMKVTPFEASTTAPAPHPAVVDWQEWALLAPFLQQQFGELEGKFAQGFKGFVPEVCGSNTPSTSASLSPRLDSLCGSPPSAAPAHRPGLAQSAPPGVFFPTFRPPPGLPHPPQQLVGVGMDVHAAPEKETCDEAASTEWCIQNVFAKLKASSCGFALVSPSLQVGGCTDLRMHFLPGQAWAASQRSRKSASTKSRDSDVSAPVNGAVRLKFDGCGEGPRLEFYLFVGPVRQGPFVCDFAERPVHEIPLSVNWRKHLEVGGQNLSLRLQIVG
mmetsp:Transcript_104742/g.301128  ORF Transcript_104742/g.301128 Transcript_104742/m.301128 type:complete len:287 (-) Transcript_104742:372-1232(-)